MTRRGLSQLRYANSDKALTLGIPVHLAVQLELADLVGKTFQAELVDGGIMFWRTDVVRPIGVLPDWVKP